MLLDEVEKELRIKFTSFEFKIDKKKHLIKIKGSNSIIGDIEIEDNLEELIIVIGNFTHWHAGCYDESLSKREKEHQIVTEVINFLTDLFNDKIVIWGSHKNVGGFYYIDKNQAQQDTPLEEENGINKYVWSGNKVS